MSKFTKTLAAVTVACGLALSASTSASATGMAALGGLKDAAPQSTVINVGRRGRNVGFAILGAAAATAIIAGAARAERRGYYRDRRYERCEYYDYKCSQGYGWACRKFDNYCDY